MALNQFPRRAFSGAATIDTFTGNGSTTAFTLNQAQTQNECFVYVDDVAQVPNADYGINGTTLTFTSAPANGSEIVVRGFGVPTPLNSVSDGAITASKLASGAIETKLGYTPVSPTQLSTEVNNLIAGAPGALNTLDELAAALGDDANYAATITTALSNKVDKINITGTSVGSATQIPIITYNAQGQITSTATAALDLSTKVNKSGDTMTGTLKIKSADPLRMGVGPYGGIDFFPVGSGAQSSPFIRFYDLPTGQDIDTTTIVDDCNWAIGADDTGVSSFKILYGGGNGSTRVSTIEGVAAPFEIKDDLFTRLNIQTSLVTDTQGTTSITGTSQFSPYNTTPTRGSYLVSVSIQSRGGSATGGDQDQSCITLYKNSTAMATADVFRTDSSYISYEDYGSFTVIVNVNGSDTLRTTLYTTDPGDPGGADVNYNVRVWKIGA